MSSQVLYGVIAAVGSGIGGTAAFLAAVWISRRLQQGNRARLTTGLRQRETLYSQFVEACAGLMRESRHQDLAHSEALVDVLATLNRIRLTATTPVLQAAEATLQDILQHYVNDASLTTGDIADYLRECTRQGADPMAKFSRACRDELWELRPALS